MKQFFLFFYRIYAALIFGLVAAVAYIFYVGVFTLASKEKMAHSAHRVSRWWANVALNLMFVRMKVSNKSFIDKNKTYVFVSNHRSLLDVPTWAVSCKNTVKYLSKEEMLKVPVMGYVLKRIYLKVKRDSKEDRARSMERMNQTIKDGISIFIAPEGRRNKTDNYLLPFHDGAFRLAIRNQVPVAALTILNSRELLRPKEPLKLHPGTVKAIWSDPIETKGMTEDNISELKEQVRFQMIEKLKNYDKKV